MHVDLPTTVKQDLLADGQAETEAIRVRILGPLHFPEKRKQFVHLFLLDALACITDMHLQLFLVVIIGRTNSYPASMSEFKCVFCQVYQDLLKSDLITDEFERQADISAEIVITITIDIVIFNLRLLGARLIIVFTINFLF